MSDLGRRLAKLEALWRRPEPSLRQIADRLAFRQGLVADAVYEEAAWLMERCPPERGFEATIACAAALDGRDPAEVRAEAERVLAEDAEMTEWTPYR